MPEEGMKWLPREELLTYEELTRVARVCVERFGFESIRITGGRADGPGPPARSWSGGWPTSASTWP